MRSNLSTGLDTAKGLALAWGIPFIGVHHMQAHALAPRLKHELDKYPDLALSHDGNLHSIESFPSFKPAPDVKFPFLSLLVSGGHTMLLHSKGITNHESLGATRDIAIGDALDKIGREILPSHWLHRADIDDMSYARVLSEYAFPPRTASLRHENIHDQELGEGMDAYQPPKHRGDESSKPDNEYGWHIDSPFSQTREIVFSFTGLVSRVNSIYQSSLRLTTFSELERLVLARTALTVAFEHLASKTVLALGSLEGPEEANPCAIVVSGGVASNTFLRHVLRTYLDARGFSHVRLIYPPASLCTDNAAIIGWAGMEMYLANYRSSFDCEPRNVWGLDPKGEDGGIFGQGSYKIFPSLSPPVYNPSLTADSELPLKWSQAPELFEAPMVLDPKDLRPYLHQSPCGVKSMARKLQEPEGPQEIDKLPESTELLGPVELSELAEPAEPPEQAMLSEQTKLPESVTQSKSAKPPKSAKALESAKPLELVKPSKPAKQPRSTQRVGSSNRPTLARQAKSRYKANINIRKVQSYLTTIEDVTQKLSRLGQLTGSNPIQRSKKGKTIQQPQKSAPAVGKAEKIPSNSITHSPNPRYEHREKEKTTQSAGPSLVRRVETAKGKTKKEQEKRRSEQS